MPFVTRTSSPKHVHSGASDHDIELEDLEKASGEITDPALLADITALQDLYQSAITGMSAAVTRAQQLLAQQNRTGTLDLRLFQEVFATQAVEALRQSLRDVSDGTAEQVLLEARRAIERLPAGIYGKMSFDAKDPRAIAWAEQRAGAMIAQIQAEALTAVRGIISRVLSSGGGVPRAAKEIQRVIGLHDRWQRAVDNFYGKEVGRLSRTMSIDSAIQKAEEASLKYRDQLIRARSLNIARTEILASQNIGTLLGWYQASDQGFLDLADARKEWVVGPDGWKGVEVCAICMDLAGQQVPVTAVFSNGEICPPAHPSCRCSMSLLTLVSFDEQQASRVADEALLNDVGF
jgi:hypothetical protein